MTPLKNILKIAVIALVVVSWSSCEDDFSDVGTDLLGDSGFVTEPYDEAEVVAYSKKINSVQTSDLPQYLLGAYYDPVFGVSEANILAQVTLSQENPDFGTAPVLDSAVLVLPYYSSLTDESTNEEKIYELDSVYGDSPIKISVLESTYFLRDLDPESNFEEEQLYYSDQLEVFESYLATPLATVESFTPSPDEVILYEENLSGGETTIDTLELSPRLRVQLSTDFFQQKILDKQGSSELFSNSNFKSYFRGIYLKAEAINGQGSMAAFNLLADEAKIVLYYTSSTANEDTEESSFQFELKLAGNSVNAYNNEFLVDLSAQDSVNGEENLYLKGGEGSMAIIELFSGPDSDEDGVSDRLEELREKNWLINEANLVFSVNSTIATTGEKEPERVFIYNLENNTVLLDYQIDYTANDNLPVNSRVIHLERLNSEEDGNHYYKIRLTNHINNIINNDSTNVKLGLTVSSNVNLSTISELGNEGEENVVTKVPKSSVITPEGTVLYGNNTSNEEKRLKLNIYYTESE